MSLSVQMCFYAIATKYNGPLEAAQAHIHNDRYDMVECYAAGKSKLDLSDQLRSWFIGSTNTISLSSANMLLGITRSCSGAYSR